MTIPESVTLIEHWAFGLCNNMTDLYSLATPRAAASKDAFDDVNYSCKLHVPNGSAKLYRSAEGWKYFLTIREDATSIEAVIDDAVTDIVGYYNLNGERSDNPWPGINIVILTDGSTRKVIR